MLDWATASDQFWDQVEPAGDCWNWAGEFVDGNATVGNVDGVVWSAHRFAFIILVGPIPAGTHISRACRNPACVNPDHLEFEVPPGSFQPGRTPRHKAARTLCPQGHLYDKASIYRRGIRVCRTCQQARFKPRPKKRKRRRKARVVVHGKNATYMAGCRCDDCKAAAREYRREYSARRKPPPEPRICAWCTTEFQPNPRGGAIYCSPKCRGASYRSRYGSTPPALPRLAKLPQSRKPWALVAEWFIEPDPDLVMLQAIAAEQQAAKLKSRSRRKSKRM